MLHGNTRATIKDVAAHAGVSIATVSRVINQSAHVAETTTQRVWAAIDELSYRPQAAARGLATQKTNIIGLIVSEIAGYFFQPMLRGIETGVREVGFDLLIHSTQQGTLEKIANYPLGEHNTDGILVFTGSLSNAELRRLHASTFPLVLLHQSSPVGLNIPSVTVENRAGARRMMDHLIEVCGYKRIAYLRGPAGSEDSYWRELGYRDALLAHGLSVDETLIGQGDFNEAAAGQQIRRWLADSITFEAVFAGDDDSALGVIAALRTLGLSVPDDIAVVGFDDSPIARYVTPALTTVRSPIEQVGYRAVEQLNRLLHNEMADYETLLPCELVIRDSCGAHRESIR